MDTTYKPEYLTGRRLDTFLAAGAVIIPADADQPGGGTLATAGVADANLARMDTDLRKKLLLFLTVTETLGIVFGGRRFSRNSEAARIRQLKWMESGPVRLFRLGFFGLKNTVCMGHYTREDVWKTMDYDGPVEPDRAYVNPRVRALCQGRLEVAP